MLWILIVCGAILMLVVSRGPKCPYCGARTRPPLFSDHNQVQRCSLCGNTFDYADVDVYRRAEEARKRR